VTATDLQALVSGYVAASIDAAGAGGENIGYAVTFSPITSPDGTGAVAWMFILTIPSALFGTLPHCVQTDPLICASLPSRQQLDQVIGACLPPLRAARQAEKNAALADGAASRARLN
jgi:hypothetical protein